jgi:hypothetical protein
MLVAIDRITAASKKEIGRSFWFRCCNKTKLLQTYQQKAAESEAAATQFRT